MSFWPWPHKESRLSKKRVRVIFLKIVVSRLFYNSPDYILKGHECYRRVICGTGVEGRFQAEHEKGKGYFNWNSANKPSFQNPQNYRLKRPEIAYFRCFAS